MIASLMTVRQRCSKSLHEFLARFKSEAAEIPNLIDKLAFTYLAVGVDKFRYDLLLEKLFDKKP